MDIPLRLTANRFCGCSGWALAPFFVLFLWFCCLLCFSAGETQVWLGDLRVVVLVGFCGFVCCYRFAYSIGHALSFVQYVFCFYSRKDRAFRATSATLEGKKNTAPLLLCVWVRAALCTAWMVDSFWLTIALKYLHARTAALLVFGPSSG